MSPFLVLRDFTLVRPSCFKSTSLCSSEENSATPASPQIGVFWQTFTYTVRSYSSSLTDHTEITCPKRRRNTHTSIFWLINLDSERSLFLNISNQLHPTFWCIFIGVERVDGRRSRATFRKFGSFGRLHLKLFCRNLEAKLEAIWRSCFGSVCWKFLIWQTTTHPSPNTHLASRTTSNPTSLCRSLFLKINVTLHFLSLSFSPNFPLSVLSFLSRFLSFVCLFVLPSPGLFGLPELFEG